MSRKRKVLFIFIGAILFLFFSPITYCKTYTTIDTQNKSNETDINGSTTETEAYQFGIGLIGSEKDQDLKNNDRFIVNRSLVLNFGIYSKLTKELSFHRIINNEKVKTIIKAESHAWGLGRLSIKKNIFNKLIEKRIDDIYSEN